MEISSEDSINKKIKLPRDMTIGIEIESEGKSSAVLLRGKEVIEGWKTKTDKSLLNGVEVISPVLRSEENREQEIYDVCHALKLFENYTTERCGGHVHIGADYLKNIDAWKNLVEIWSNAENILYLISNQEGKTPRATIMGYAAPISGNIAEAIENGEVNLEDEEDIEKFCNDLKRLQGRIDCNETRYSGINFQNFGNKHKNTIEFRVSNGTINPDTWIENINLFGGLIVISQELSEIQEKLQNGIEITDSEQEKIDAFEMIKESSDEEQKLECLLNLVVGEEERPIYANRYIRNNRKMLGIKIVRDAGHIIINKKKIGKLAFTGENRVIGEDYEKCSKIIQNELDRENIIE